MSFVEEGMIAGNYDDKYNAGNWISRRLVHGFQRSLMELALRSDCKDVHEVGCGEGHLARILARRGFSVRASDFSQQVIDAAKEMTQKEKLHLDFKVASISNLDFRHDSADLIVCCEVLEHLEDPSEALKIIARLTKKSAIFSVPREPIWRALNLARLKYISNLGNTPGHVQHWSKSSFLRFIQTKFVINEVRTPFPWSMLLARPKN